MVTHPAGRTDPKKWLSMRTFFSRGLDRKRNLTRMHSSRMRTARSCSRPGGLHQASPWDQTPPTPGNHLGAGTPRTRHPPGIRHPLDQAPSRSRHPQTRHSPGIRHPPGPGNPPGTRDPSLREQNHRHL